jgi:hypothetical protein
MDVVAAQGWCTGRESLLQTLLLPDSAHGNKSAGWGGGQTCLMRCVDADHSPVSEKVIVESA